MILVTIAVYYLEEDQHDFTEAEVDTSKGAFFYLPSSTTGVVVAHKDYSLSYSEKHEQAEWVAYELRKAHLSKNDFKRPFFEVDKKVMSSSADWRNYKKSGYDKGHLCPAGDRRYSYDAFDETFLTSNVSPQNHEFNAGVWNKLEQKIRYWAAKYDGVYVVTGGVLTEDLETIGYEAVSVPKYFYKVVYDHSPNTPKMIAFLIPNKPTDKSFDQFIVSVDAIEKLTGIDFFPKLEDHIENNLEDASDKSVWKF